MTQKVYIIHGWGGTPSSDWYNWLKLQLESKGFDVKLPEMPDTIKPTIESWLGKLKEIVESPDHRTFFVGHSMGCQAILRYLETLDDDVKIGGCVFVAPWFHLSEETWDEEWTYDTAKEWIETPIDFSNIKNKINHLVSIFSTNDPYVPLTDKDIFKALLSSEIIVLNDKGHMTGEDGITELPIVLEKILEISSSFS